ncbi:TonB-dependent receptor [Chitinophaga skermanii]|nr:TonB-dependent receptor [Chitinophaga skermanii]
MKKLLLTWCLIIAYTAMLYGQKAVEGRIIDAETKEALQGVSVSISGHATGCYTDAQGKFKLTVPQYHDTLQASYIGYTSQKVAWTENRVMLIALEPNRTKLNEFIVTSSRDKQERKDAPIAISTISKQMMNETKATSLEQLLNKVSGVYMVDLGNEQHTMAIRQPIGYKSLFLYMEDGVPIRTTGDFNHNALIEINMAALSRIEVVRGPASSLYGSEAVGGAINFITANPTALPYAKVQVEASDWGYRRADVMVSNTFNKVGIVVGGYYAKQSNGYMDHSDFHKLALNVKVDYNINHRFKWTNAASIVNYKTDQVGGLDSAHFYGKDYRNFHTFSYREVKAFRYRSTLTANWDASNQTNLTFFYRNNEIGQNPFYAVKNVVNNPLKARGEINSDAFASYGVILQHKKSFKWKEAAVIAGISMDNSPSDYYAHYIDIDRNQAGYYINYTSTDSVLTNYHVNLLNSAAYVQAEFAPIEHMKFVAALRYDRMDYNFNNYLPPSAFTGAPDEKNYFQAWTPKLGITYDFGKGLGTYVNYSVGFAPPNISELYRGVKVPTLKPARYQNYEAGGWWTIPGYAATLELGVYRMNGTNEIVSVRLADGSYENRNAGKTTHTGIEWNLRYEPIRSILLRVSGTYAEHKFLAYQEQGKTYDGNIMNSAPKVISNAEVTFKPVVLKGVRMGLEWQYVGPYYMDVANTKKYDGYNLLNARLGYNYKNIECWVNCRNVANSIYATTAEKTVYATTYRPGPKRTFNVGLAYTFTGKNKS